MNRSYSSLTLPRSLISSLATNCSRSLLFYNVKEFAHPASRHWKASH
jgi:hypothetical protein